MLIHRQYIFLLMTVSLTLTALAKPASEQLQFNIEGKFRILQFTDIHWKNESGNNQKVLQIMESVLDAEKPDLVIMTGDIVTSRPAHRGWEAVVQPIIKRRIPWAVTLGNHDEEQDLKRAEIIPLIKDLPYSLVESGPADVSGEGNYILRIVDSQKQTAAVIYCLDSHAYAPRLPGQKDPDYAWIEPSQIDWYRKSSQLITASHGKPLPSLAFFHIPLPEYNTAWDSRLPAAIGSKGESVCCPKENSAMFAAMVECKDVMGVFVGHDHMNDYAGFLQGICLVYGRATGLDTYGKLPKGGRVIELKENRREFDTWVRTADGAVQNRVRYPASFE